MAEPITAHIEYDDAETEREMQRLSEAGEVVEEMLAESDKEWALPMKKGLADAEARTEAVFWLKRLAGIRAVRQREADEIKQVKALLVMKATRKREDRDYQEADILQALEILFKQMQLQEDAKSVDTLGGRVGTKLTGETMKVTDEDKLVLWLHSEGLGGLVEIVDAVTIDTKDLKIEMRRRLEETGEVGAPGVDYTPAEDKFYATPDGD